MAAAHPFGAFVGCRFKRIGCICRIKVNSTNFMFYRTCYITPISLTVLPLNSKTQFSVIHEQPILYAEFLFFFKIYSDRWTGTLPLNFIQSIQYTDS